MTSCPAPRGALHTLLSRLRERYKRLARMLADRVGAEAHERIVALAAMLPRAQVVDRARAAVTSVEDPRDAPRAASRMLGR